MTQSRLDIEPSARSNFFHTPQTPSSTVRRKSSIATSSDSPYFSGYNPRDTLSRKRSRNDSWDSETPGSTAPSPAPFANMNYRLAGGLDTPTAVTSQYSIYETSTPDVSFRRGKPYLAHERKDYFHEHGGDMIRGMPGKDGNGRAPQSLYIPAQNTWSSLVFGLAGKVFDFCTAGTFRGFFSGGGQGYSLASPGSAIQWHLSSPRRFDDSDWLDVRPIETMDQADQQSPVAKRSKTVHDNTWVMVDPPMRDASPHKPQPSLIPRPSSPASFSRSPSPTRIATTASSVTIGRSSSRPVANLRRTISTRTASSAGLRSPERREEISQLTAKSTHRRSSSFKTIPTGLHQRRNSHTIDPISTAPTNIKSPLSAGSPSLHQGIKTYEQAESPLAKETRKHIDKLRKSELAEDREIMRMNRQLKDLIKQGQEALGTRIEVDFGDDGR